MKALNVKNMSKAGQAGFTIIELVVVILLLGILTATALPRFLDISDEAHEAVVNAHLGSLSTAVNLYRAAWYANQQTTLGIDYDGTGPGVALFPSTTGFPAGLVDSSVNTEADCVAIFTNLMQSGGTALTAGLVGGTTPETAINTGAILDTTNPYTTADFAAMRVDLGAPGIDASDVCEYYYVGQFNTTATTPRLIRYTPSTGALVVDTSAALGPRN